MQSCYFEKSRLLTVAYVTFSPNKDNATRSGLTLKMPDGTDLTTAHYDVLKITTASPELVIAGLRPSNPCAHVMIEDGSKDPHFPLHTVTIFDSHFETLDIKANIFDITMGDTYIDALNLRALPPQFYPNFRRPVDDDHVMNVCITSPMPSPEKCAMLRAGGVVLRRYGDIVPV